jgi:uncharacterized protein YyaL (SSP411 family)
MNRLIEETSPYLKQHADNPVDWYPWGKEALEKARHENKPILLSIGYAACHWCHVMAHESFEDNETAALMNQLFINIKVDREERPDLDKIYQTAHYILTQQGGGWPLTVFLSPDDLVPFFSGTYFPSEARYHLPAFKDLLRGIADTYEHCHDDIRQQNKNLMHLLQQKSPALSNHQFTEEPIQSALHSLEHQYDPVNGGFNGAPKFPQPGRLKFLLDHNSPIVTVTLKQMAERGIMDQLGGGFYRYSVDAKWEIPHFEKMLYDNGQLLFLYAHRLDEPFFADITRRTAHWIMQAMQSPEGGYYSSMDADSEGHEGSYYLWQENEIAACLTADEYKLVRAHFGLDKPPNFEKKWHLTIAEPLADVAIKLNLSLENANQLLFSAKEKMLTLRNQRVPPARDNKILTAWNGLAIKGMLAAGDASGEQEWITSACKALLFIEQKLWVNKRLLASYHEEKAHHPAYLDDYVFLIDALLTSLQVSWHTDRLTFAIELTETLLTYFSDDEGGGFYFTAKDHEQLLYRPKSMMDDVIPAGNGAAVNVLLTLGYLLGEPRYLDAAEKILHAAYPALKEFPAEHCTLLEGLNHFLKPRPIVVIRGKNQDIKIWRDQCKRNQLYVFAIPENAQNLPAALASKSIQGGTCAYVCQGLHCSNVIDDLNELSHFLLHL